MAPMLNKYFFIAVVFISQFCFAQNNIDHSPPDYKGGDQFKHFHERRTEISKWQINQLKTGALVVRLKTNHLLIDALTKAGKSDLATQKLNEMYIQNKIMVRAYALNYNFSKVYFMFSSSSDALLNGTKSGIFLDTNLVVDPGITLNEKYYLIAEDDYSYSSSIGFVKEDSARFVKEAGTSQQECVVILKNKYNHQLWHPFPFRVVLRASATTTKVYEKNSTGATISGEISKARTYKKFMSYIKYFNDNLNEFYNSNKNYEVTDPKIKPFLY